MNRRSHLITEVAIAYYLSNTNDFVTTTEVLFDF